jgi:tellurite resistance protein TerC
MDNLFVFLMLFSFFGVQRKYQHEVLFWGIIGALVLRSFFIFAGTAVIARFEWVLGLFGLFLIYTGIKMFWHKGDEHVDPSRNVFVKVFKRFFPVTDQMHDDKFFIKETRKRRDKETGERWLATPLFIALIVIETTDVAFAVDSIPAVFSVSRDPFIVLTSNIFAILGLRALYFALAAIAKYFTYLKYGLGIILSFVGIKMLLEVLWGIEVSTPLSLAFIFVVLAISMLAGRETLNRKP